jgi:hypothetical protein
MVMPRGRRRLLRVLAVTVAAGCLVAAGAWRYGPWRERYAVAMPPARASPRQVVRAYLHALDGHDAGTAMALSAAGHRSATAYWLARTASVRVVRIGAVQYYPGDPPGQRYVVPTDFVYSSYSWEHYDPSFWNGAHYWEYWLVHPHGRWLIRDEGTG